MLCLISGPAANPSWWVLEHRSHPAAMLGNNTGGAEGGQHWDAMHGGGGGCRTKHPLLPAPPPPPPHYTQLVPVGAVRSHFFSMPQEKDFTYFLLFFFFFQPPLLKSVTRTLWLLSLFQLFDILHNRIIYVTRLEVLCMLTGN